MSELMSEFTSWLKNTIWLVFQTEGLFRDEDSLSIYCRAFSKSSRAAVTDADHFFMKGKGRDLLRKQLLEIPEMGKLDESAQADVCDMLGYYFSADRCFAPYAAEVLGLREKYAFAPEVVIDKKTLAVLFNRTLHMLMEKNHDVLVKSILMWSVGSVMYLVNSGSFFLDLNEKAYWFVTNELDTPDLHWPQRYCILDQVFVVEYGESIDTIFGKWINGAMRGIFTSSGAKASPSRAQDLSPSGIYPPLDLARPSRALL